MSNSPSFSTIQFSEFSDYISIISSYLIDKLLRTHFKDNLDLSNITPTNFQLDTWIDPDQINQFGAIIIALKFTTDQPIDEDLQDALDDAFELVLADVLELDHPSAIKLYASLAAHNIWFGRLDDILHPMVIATQPTK